MKEKVYSVDDQWDGLIIAGVADFKAQPYYFNSIFEEEYTDTYELILLPEPMFRLTIQNWNYWVNWYHSERVDSHPKVYCEFRDNHDLNAAKEQKFFSDPDQLSRAETYYQNDLVIKDFLKSTPPTIYAKGKFFGDRDGIEETHVIWTQIAKRSN